MFAATITLTVNAIAKVLNRVNQDNYGSEYAYKGATESIILKVRHSQDSADGDLLKMDRHNVFIEHVIYPTPTTAMKKSTFTATIRGSNVQDPALAGYLAKASMVWLQSGTIVDGLVSGEN